MSGCLGCGTAQPVANPETLAKTRTNEASLALVQPSTCFEHTPLIDTCSLQFWVVSFFERIQFNFVQNEARTCLSSCIMPAKAPDGGLLNVERARCGGTQACGRPRQRIVRWAARLAWTDAASTEVAAVPRPSGLWQRLECVAVPPGAHGHHQINPAGNACSMWRTGLAAHCERGVPPRDGIGLVGCS